MAKVPDTITLKELCDQAARALARAGMDHRIDIYRDVDVDDPAVRMMLGRSHKVRLRIKITGASLLFDADTNGEAIASDLGAVDTNGAAALTDRAERPERARSNGRAPKTNR